jgi:hypothetical protein
MTISKNDKDEILEDCHCLVGRWYSRHTETYLVNILRKHHDPVYREEGSPLLPDEEAILADFRTILSRWSSRYPEEQVYEANPPDLRPLYREEITPQKNA